MRNACAMIAILVGVTSVLGRNLVRVLLGAKFSTAVVEECADAHTITALLSPPERDPTDDAADAAVAATPVLLVLDTLAAEALANVMRHVDCSDISRAALAALPLLILAQHGTDTARAVESLRPLVANVDALMCPFAPEALLTHAAQLAPALAASDVACAAILPIDHEEFRNGTTA